jgi:hypothetical protein
MGAAGVGLQLGSAYFSREEEALHPGIEMQTVPPRIHGEELACAQVIQPVGVPSQAFPFRDQLDPPD